jgi:hypothetical protein
MFGYAWLAWLQASQAEPNTKAFVNPHSHQPLSQHIFGLID